MGYQALLFCPDEKTARTVTQVLGELDFTVVPCTEPFAAVKQLMAEHFDAIVVDCDNEQNATLLFKSARNAAGSQSSLAVAVVEGQAGVAKAFRIGANLVLTKPINVDQAKGTLRVARGLLRKGETTKPAVQPGESKTPGHVPASSPELTSTPARTPLKLAPSPAPAVVANVAAKPGNQPRVTASAPIEIEQVAKDGESIHEAIEQSSSTTRAVSTLPEAVAKDVSPLPVQAAAQAPQPIVGKSFGASGAASAPAPAKEKVTASAPKVPAVPVVSEPAAVSEVVSEAKDTPLEFAAASQKTEEAAAEKKSGGSKTALLAVAAIILVAAGGYEAWLHWGSAILNGRGAPAATVNSARSAAAVPVKTLPAVAATETVKQPLAASQTPALQTSTAQSSETAENVAPRKSSAESASGSETKASAPVAKAPAKPAPKPIVIKSNGTHSTALSAAPVVSMTEIADAGAAEVPNLIGGKAPTPVLQPPSVSQGVSQGVVLKKVQPSYPAYAMQLRIEGAVQLLATVAKNGNVTAVKVVKGDPELAQAAAAAVKQWKYKPFLLNGSPVEMQTQITVNFKLPQ